jgi:hypothetical protein
VLELSIEHKGIIIADFLSLEPYFRGITTGSFVYITLVEGQFQ